MGHPPTSRPCDRFLKEDHHHVIKVQTHCGRIVAMAWQLTTPAGEIANAYGDTVEEAMKNLDKELETKGYA